MARGMVRSGRRTSAPKKRDVVVTPITIGGEKRGLGETANS